ncbi:hypothetical protein Csa_003805 [Cucumis sativus]|nr:hypothetical protein Csa_003805 [Cucumis sativus]
MGGTNCSEEAWDSSLPMEKLGTALLFSIKLGKPLKKSLHEVIVVSQSIMRTQRIFGLLQVKSLLTVTAEAETPVGAVSIRRIHRVPSDIPLYDILNVFQKGNNHMVVVVKVKEKTKNSALSSNGEKHGEKSFTSGISPLENVTATTRVCNLFEDIEDGEIIRIITLEDIFVELLQVITTSEEEKIVDEAGVYVDVYKRICVVAAAAVALAPSACRLPLDRPKVHQTTSKYHGRMEEWQYWNY